VPGLIPAKTLLRVLVPSSWQGQDIKDENLGCSRHKSGENQKFQQIERAGRISARNHSLQKINKVSLTRARRYCNQRAIASSTTVHLLQLLFFLDAVRVL
jgi:hypothetical protein